MKILTADHVLPITSNPIEQGAIAINGEFIDAVGSASDLTARYPNAEVVHLGHAAILPGFVNCHAHLELSAFRGALDSVEHDFRKWLLKLNELRAGAAEADLGEWAYNGAMEGVRAGVTCFGDVGRLGGLGFEALRRAGLRGIVFQETEFSPDARTANDDLSELIEKFEELRRDESPLIKVGISPHSPFTVSSRLLEMIAQFSIIEKVPVTIHTAESAKEHELLTNGVGFFVDVYEKFEVEWQSPHCTPVEYLERLGVLSAQPLLAHCVLVSESDIKRIASNGTKIAHCPKSNAKFGHGIAPFEMFLDAEIAVGLGSDSVASNNLCDLLDEARSAVLMSRIRPDRQRFVSAREVLSAATLSGAAALGLENVIGSLEEGKQADLAVISLNEPAQRPIHDIEATLVFSSSGQNVRRTYVAGKLIFDKECEPN
jgi:5-methylthioadenosine/S-adenosylhomocysteine deaminase